MIDLRNADERAAAAAEYVLGTLDADDQRQVAEALPGHAALRAEVGAWQDRLLPLTARAPAADPSPSLWARIERSIVPAGMAPARAPSPRGAAPSWWQGLRLWQALAATAASVALVLAVQLARPPEPAARYLAVLQSPQNQSTGWLVEVQAGATVRLIPVGAPGVVPPGRSWQFWTKPEGAAAPTSLGLVRAGQTLQLPASQLPAVGRQQLFEITLEPEGGSPVGRPTGPILYVGRSVAL